VIDVAVAGPAILGEGPVWDARRGELLWVDITAGAVNAYMPETGATRRIELGENVGCVALTRDAGTVVGALRSGWYWVDLEDGTKELIAPVPDGAPNQRFNDGAVDSAGRFWRARSRTAKRTRSGGCSSSTPTCAIGSSTAASLCSNGLAWSLDDRWLFFVDSTPRRDLPIPVRRSDGAGRRA